MKTLLIASIAAAMAFPVFADSEIAPSTTTNVTAPQGAAIESTTTTTVPPGTAIESTTTTTTSTSQKMEEAVAPKEDTTSTPALDEAPTTYDQQQRMDDIEMQNEEKNEFVPSQINDIDEDADADY